MSEGTLIVGFMIIDCDTCEVRGKACGDCMVSFLNVPVRGGASVPITASGIVMDADQEAAVEALVAGGLVPPLRLVPGVGAEHGHPARVVASRRAG